MVITCVTIVMGGILIGVTAPIPGVVAGIACIPFLARMNRVHDRS